MGPFSAVYGRCYGGIADRYRLDIPAALTNFRDAFEIAGGLGPHSHAVRLAGALLGQLLRDRRRGRGHRLLEESYQFGSEGGGVDYLAARFVIGARIRALHTGIGPRRSSALTPAWTPHNGCGCRGSRPPSTTSASGSESRSLRWLPPIALDPHHSAQRWNSHAHSRTRREFSCAPAGGQRFARRSGAGMGTRGRSCHGNRRPAQTPGGPAGRAAPDRNSHCHGPSRGSSRGCFARLGTMRRSGATAPAS